MGLAQDTPLETIALLNNHRSQAFGCNIGHITGALIHTAKLTAIAYWAPHHMRQFRHDLIGHLPQAGDPAGFAAACLALLSDPQAADRLGTRLRALQQARFSREAVESRIEKALREGLATGSERVRSPGP